MKIRLLVSLLMISLLAACGGAGVKKANEHYVDQEFKLKFRDIGERWEKQDPGPAKQHGTIHYFYDPVNRARVWVRATPYEHAPALPLKEGADAYVERKAGRYSWADLKVAAEAFDTFNGEQSFWKVYAYRLGSKEKKEKIYRVYHGKISYQFRLRCPGERFDALLPEFDAWLASIEFLE